MKVCVPVTDKGQIGPRWGKADRLAVADVTNGEITDWQEVEVGWAELHDQGTEGSHHARVVRFLRDHHIEMVLAGHMGTAMHNTLQKMGLRVHLGVAGDARAAVRAAAA